jgi:hypothetical protein
MDGRLWGNLARGKAGSSSGAVAYINIGPTFEYLPDPGEPFVPGNLRLVERTGVNDATRVLVQVLRDTIYIPVLESLDPVEDKLYLRGVGGLQAGHCNEANEERGSSSLCVWIVKNRTPDLYNLHLPVFTSPKFVKD